MPVSTTRYTALAPVKQFVGRLVDQLSTSKYKGKSLAISDAVTSNKELVKNANIVQRPPISVAKFASAVQTASAPKPDTARYIESELHSPEFQDFLETIDGALDALRSKHDALFLAVLDRPTTEGRHPEQLEQLDKEFDAIRKHAFAEQYAAARKEGSSIADALKFAGAMAGEHAFIEFLTSDDPAHNGYAQAMKQFKQTIADIPSQGFKKAAVSVTYERAAQPLVLGDPTVVPAKQQQDLLAYLRAETKLPDAGIPGSATPLVKADTKSPSKSVAEQKPEAVKHRADPASLRTNAKLPDADTPWSVSPLAAKQTVAPVASKPAVREPKSAAPKKAAYDQFLKTDTLARQLAESAYADQHRLDSIDMMDMGMEVEVATREAFVKAFGNAINNGREESDALKFAHVEAREFTAELLADPEMSDYKDYANFIKQHKPEFSESTSPYTGKTHIGIEYKFQPMPAAILPKAVPQAQAIVTEQAIARQKAPETPMPQAVKPSVSEEPAAIQKKHSNGIGKKAKKVSRSIVRLLSSPSKSLKKMARKMRRRHSYDFTKFNPEATSNVVAGTNQDKAKQIAEAKKADIRVKFIDGYKLPNT